VSHPTKRKRKIEDELVLQVMDDLAVFSKALERSRELFSAREVEFIEKALRKHRKNFERSFQSSGIEVTLCRCVEGYYGRFIVLTSVILIGTSYVGIQGYGASTRFTVVFFIGIGQFVLALLAISPRLVRVYLIQWRLRREKRMS